MPKMWPFMGKAGQVSLPEPLYEQMLEFLKSHPEYTSVADLVKELVRRELRNEK